jgi:hypothetical protein
MNESQSTANPEPSRLIEASETEAPNLAELWERRSRQRFPVTDRAFIRRHGEPEHSVELVDLSEDGAGVWSTKVLVADEEVEFFLTGRRSGPLVIDAVVVDRKALGAGVWRIGLRFRQRLRPDKLAAALD